ncbi:hypothetical protein [Fervidibacillus halotolerans]|uniref:Uncharacterized protein n=1 Tax=Fervidibacillus halotolerans TaxID=2980027 RepID=A0A9E8M095_9BACI|nr:hypothetical protein [Fervidibacillus halotolerans]WAA13088.1 hypothetical protein OE105_02880 [Fervidibacillus halotolerans]
MGYILPMNHYGDRHFRNRIEKYRSNNLLVQPSMKVEKIQFDPRKLSQKRKGDQLKGMKFDRYV